MSPLKAIIVGYGRPTATKARRGSPHEETP
ncbi:hypothetical protein FHS44_002794 [Streptosporangium saharense]|uniref:Uncharacterized protein n=1 Tax=Streptosporangium saharense TaxID=1706840 RepID=A0A7W7QLP6_9ACTN|nr:hypothetical protein [Streptosporangium saharense]